MIIWRIRPHANDHLEDLAPCKWSSGGSGLLQMIIQRNRPLANDHPSPSSPLSPLPESRFNLADLTRTICSCCHSAAVIYQFGFLLILAPNFCTLHALELCRSISRCERRLQANLGDEILTLRFAKPDSEDPSSPTPPSWSTRSPWSSPRAVTPGSRTKTVVDAIIRCSSSSRPEEAEEATDLAITVVMVVVVVVVMAMIVVGLLPSCYYHLSSVMVDQKWGIQGPWICLGIFHTQALSAIRHRTNQDVALQRIRSWKVLWNIFAVSKSGNHIAGQIDIVFLIFQQ